MALSTLPELQSCTAGARQRLTVAIERADAAQAATCRKYKGVRFRADRKSWVAEMKPFKYKNKVSFGDFKSAMEAARAVDAAFYYYDKNKWRNFRDSPEFLPPLPGALDEEGKLKFVKEQARLLAFWTLLVPSTWDPGNRCEELKSTRTHPVRTFKPIEPGSDSRAGCRNGDIPETSICNLDAKDCFEAIEDNLVRSQEALDALHNCTEAASLSIQPLETVIRSDTLPDLVDGSQASIRPLTKTLCASTTTILETFPEIPDDDELWTPIRSDSLFDELRPLDVNDYIEILEVEHSPVQGSAFTLQ